MPTDKQIQASRANGARSQGPVTPEGKRNSARNSTRHSLLAQTVVLEAENRDQFLDLLQSFMDEYQPATPTETVLVETMAAAHWRILRIMSLQKTAFDRDIAQQDPAIGPSPVRALFSLGGRLPRTACAPELLLRYETTYNRQFSRAHTRLLALQSTPSPRAADPYCPTSPAADIWNNPAPPEGPEIDFATSVLRHEMSAIDPKSAGLTVMPLSDYISAAWFGPRLISFFLGVLGAISILLAAIGLYGVLAHAVSQRIREIGIRMALGAAREGVLRMVLRRGLLLAIAGVAGGLAITVVAAPQIAPLLYRVSPADPVSILGAAVFLSVVALLASLIPALRATRIDPIIALRQE